MQASSWPRLRPDIASSCEQPDRVFVGGARRPRWRPATGRSSPSPSWTANRVLVLPCSIASSIRRLPEEDVAGGDAADRAVEPVRRRSAPSASRPSATPVDGLGRPGGRCRSRRGRGRARSRRRRSARSRSRSQTSRQRSKACGQHLQRLERRRRRAAHVLGEGGRGPLGGLGRRAPGSRRQPIASQRPPVRMRAGLDQDARRPCAPSISRSLGHFRLTSAGRHVGARRGRRPPGRRRTRPARPRPAAWSVVSEQGGGEVAVAGLPARPRRPRPAVWRRRGDPERAALAGLGAAARLGVGGVDLVAARRSGGHGRRRPSGLSAAERRGGRRPAGRARSARPTTGKANSAAA